MRYLSEALKANTALKTLNLSTVRQQLGDNHIKEEGAKCIGQVLAANKTLKFLDISNGGGNGVGGNRIGVEGATSISDAFQANKSLISLDLCKPYSLMPQ